MSPWWVVGTRADGSRLIIEGATSRDAARQRAKVLAAYLEDCVRVEAEQQGRARRKRRRAATDRRVQSGLQGGRNRRAQVRVRDAAEAHIARAVSGE